MDTFNLTISPVLQPNGKYLIECDPIELLQIKRGLSLLEYRRKRSREYYREKKQEAGGEVKPRDITHVTLNIIRPQ